MLVLILVYTFQFESSINVWSNMTGMSREKYAFKTSPIETNICAVMMHRLMCLQYDRFWCRNWTHHLCRLEDLGLEKFSVPALFTRIFIPTSFLLVCILHLHYFHERFLELTDIKSVADKQKSTISRYSAAGLNHKMKVFTTVKMHLAVGVDGRLWALHIWPLQLFPYSSLQSCSSSDWRLWVDSLFKSSLTFSAGLRSGHGLQEINNVASKALLWRWKL